MRGEELNIGDWVTINGHPKKITVRDSKKEVEPIVVTHGLLVSNGFICINPFKLESVRVSEWKWGTGSHVDFKMIRYTEVPIDGKVSYSLDVSSYSEEGRYSFAIKRTSPIYVHEL